MKIYNEDHSKIHLVFILKMSRIKNVKSLYLFLCSFPPTLLVAHLNGKKRRPNLPCIYLTKWSVKLHDVGLFIRSAGLLGACHGQHAARVVPLDTYDVHASVD